jgi:hypothetical protein
MSTPENPYAPPRATDRVVGIKSGRREDLRTVAVAQKSILVCILLYLIAIICLILVPIDYRVYIQIGVGLLGLAALVSVFVLAMRVYGVGLGILMGIGALLPCFGLIVLLLVSQKATKILKENGHHVGLLGADLSKF